MKYSERLTKRIKHDEKIYFYIEVANSRECTQRLGMYEDFGLTPEELAKTLTQYELQKPRDKWDMDKIEKWQHIAQIQFKNYNRRLRPYIRHRRTSLCEAQHHCEATSFISQK